MRLILVRHGQTPSNVVRALDTASPGPGLTELGQEQAEALVDVLADEPVELALASTLVRTQLTAAPFARARSLDVGVREGLREVIAGDLEMRSDDEAVTAYLSAVVAWGGGDLDRRIPGGEDGHAAMGRFDAVVAEVAASGVACAALFSHGAVIRMWVGARGANTGGSFAATHHLDNTGVVVLVGDPSAGWVVESWTGAPDLPAHDGGPAGSAASTEDGPAGDPVPVA